jgi:hypothetical protein
MRVSFSIVSLTAVKAFAMACRLAFVAVSPLALAAIGPPSAAAQSNEPRPMMSPRLPIAPTPPAVVQPKATSALLPGHWQLAGAHYVWIPPDKEPRPVEKWRLIEGRLVFDWSDGKWVWTPPHYGGN